MKSLLSKKITKDDSGIAILFSLMMLAVFLVMGMGFASYMNNVRQASLSQRGLHLNTGVEQEATYQVVTALQYYFEEEDDVSTAGEEYFATMPEASVRHFRETQLHTPTGSNKDREDFSGRKLTLPIWALSNPDAKATNGDSDPPHIQIPYLNTITKAYESTKLLMSTNSGAYSPNANKFKFYPPVELGKNSAGEWELSAGGTPAVIGWQLHTDSSNAPYAISNWVVMGMSGRIDPDHVSDSSTVNHRAKGESMAEVGLLAIAESTDSAANKKTTAELLVNSVWGSLQDLQEAVPNDPGLYNYLPNTTDERSGIATVKPGPFNLSELAGTNYGASASDNGPTQVSNVTTGIQYLSADGEQERQIAANLIDYCDADNFITHDINLADPTNPIVSFTGQENLQIKRVSLMLRPEISIESATEEKIKLNYSFRYGIDNHSPHDDIDLTKCEFNVSFRYKLVNGTNIIEEDVTWNLTPAGVGNKGTEYKNWDPGNPNSTLWTKIFTVTTLDLKIDSLEVEIYSLSVTDASGNYLDFVDLSGEVVELAGGAPIPTDTNIHFRWRADNSKFNMHSEAWSTEAWIYGLNKASLPPRLFPYPTVAGPISDPNTDRENQTAIAADPARGEWLVSTNYIRNGAMKNLHELGYIHRGYLGPPAVAPALRIPDHDVLYQTLNLVEYNDKTPGVMGAYRSTSTDKDKLYSSALAELNDGGDRSILDYVCLDDDALGDVLADPQVDTDGNGVIGALQEIVPKQGRINPNTFHPDVLKALFSNISAEHPVKHSVSGEILRVGEVEDDQAPGANDDAISVASPAKITELIKNFPGIHDSDPNLYDRMPAQTPAEGFFVAKYFVNQLNNPPSYGLPFKKTTTLTDREAEVLLCNTRRLVSVVQNYYLALVTVRSGANVSLANPDSYDTETKKLLYMKRELIDQNDPSSVDDDIVKVKLISEQTLP